MNDVVRRARVYRTVALTLSIGLSGTACLLFIQFAASDGFDALDILRLGLIAISTLWLAWGASQSVVGLFYNQARHGVQRTGAPIKGRTAILVPVYNEDPAETFSRVLAMDRSLAGQMSGATFDFAILSDTRDPQVARSEEAWFARLKSEASGTNGLFYRRREDNTGKKAGNVEDFITRSGGAYEFALILDADSLMEGRTIVEMVRRMEAEPRLGLLQSLPRIVNAQSMFGRIMQFCANFFSPVFARGIALLSGREGPFWGHNAMVRTRAFAASCGLPVLSGKPPFGGHILSHDYVEAALLARNGWLVRLDPDLEGSYEEGPENLIEFAKRDRRWCQGNLQHIKLIAAPGLSIWSRFVFVQGILAYLASPIWALFLLFSLAAPFFAAPPDYFPEPYQLFPVFPDDQTSKAITLLVGIFGLLILPKLLIMIRSVVAGQTRGPRELGRLALSVFAEIATSSVVAPIMLLFQTRSVFEVLTGIDGGWPATQRGSQVLSFAAAWQAGRSMVATGLVGLGAAFYFTPAILVWLMPILVPMVAAPLLIWLSARPMAGPIFATPEEIKTPAILSDRGAILARWVQKTNSAEISGANAAIIEPTHAQQSA